MTLITLRTLDTLLRWLTYYRLTLEILNGISLRSDSILRLTSRLLSDFRDKPTL